MYAGTAGTTVVIARPHWYDADMGEEWTEEEAANLAWRQVISIQESIVPPAVFRPAQEHCWERKLEAHASPELIATIRSFANDRGFRDWVHQQATLEQVFSLWEAIAHLNRRLYLLDEGEEAPIELVTEIRRNPSARDVCVLALHTFAADRDAPD
jgi:hypothetical protein